MFEIKKKIGEISPEFFPHFFIEKHFPKKGKKR